MNSLPPALHDEANGAAEDYADGVEECGADYTEAFYAGVRWLWARVSEGAPEFDETKAFLAADTIIDKHPLHRWDAHFTEGARWQHSQDAIQYAALYAKELTQANARVAEEQERCAQLKTAVDKALKYDNGRISADKDALVESSRKILSDALKPKAEAKPRE